MKVSAPNRRFIKEVERMTGVKVTLDQVNSGHRRLYLPDGRFVVSSLTGDNNASRATASDIRKLLKGKAA